MNNDNICQDKDKKNDLIQIIQKIQKEKERNEEKIIEDEEKFEKTPKISRFNKMKMKINKNINNLGNGYLYEYKKIKKK